MIKTKHKIALLVLLGLFIVASICIYLHRSSVNEYKDTKDLQFSDLEHIEFWHGSGAGAWRTTLNIQADGSFTGCYSHGTLETGYLHPMGTIYECNFSGTFSSLTKTGEYQYSMKCDSLKVDGTVNDAYFKDNYMYVETEPYGFMKASDFELYLPGKKTSELPDGFLDWTNGLTHDGVLTCYGLYNVHGEEGYIVWPEHDTEEAYQEPSNTPSQLEPFSSDDLSSLQNAYHDNDSLQFSDLKGLEFLSQREMSDFAVCVTIQPDGTFRGIFEEAEAYPSSDDYPNGTTYKCNFSGQFTSLKKTGSFEYTMKCESLQTKEKPGTEKIENGSKIVFTEPYGFNSSDTFKLYLPGKLIRELPEGAFKWHADLREESIYGSYSLYNVGGEDLFGVAAG